MGNISIHKARVDEAVDIAAVHVGTWQHAYRGQLPDEYLDNLSVEERTRRWKEGLEHPQPNTATLVAKDRGKVVGFCSVGPCRDDDALESTGELYAIYIDPPFQGKGAGRALMQAGIRSLQEMGFREATLWVLKSNTPTRAFYGQFGWSADGATKTEEQPNAMFHEVRYRKSLSS